MKAISYCTAVFLITLICAGCGQAPPDKPQSKAPNKDDKIKAALAKLPDDERKLAEAQKYCALHTDSRLGSMDTPVKIMIKGQPVFLCCDHCKDDALADEAKTLKTAQALKAK